MLWSREIFTVLTGEDRLLDLCSAWVVKCERGLAGSALLYLSSTGGPNGEQGRASTIGQASGSFHRMERVQSFPA